MLRSIALIALTIAAASGASIKKPTMAAVKPTADVLKLRGGLAGIDTEVVVKSVTGLSFVNAAIMCERAALPHP